MSIEHFSNTLIALSAVAGVAIAGFGLNTWKMQRNWEIDHDLSKRLLVLLYRYRDAIRGVRNPAIFGHEQPSPSEEKAVSMNHDQLRFYGISKAYENRWEKVRELRSELYANATEAEAYWGRDYKDYFQKLIELEAELAANIRAYLTAINPDEGEATRASFDKLLRSRREVMYALYSDEDEFEKAFDENLKSVESYLREKMGRARW